MRGTTDSPRYPWCPLHHDDDDEDQTPDNDDEIYVEPEVSAKDCLAIADGSALTDSYEVESYLVDFSLEIDGDTAETLARIEAFLQEYVATDLAGCNSDYSPKTGSADVQNVMIDIMQDTYSGT